MKNSGHYIHLILSVLFVMHFTLLNAQQDFTISGQLQDMNKQPVSFANVALLSYADSSIIAGTVSGDDGKFELTYNQAGSYLLSASFVGFVPFLKKIELKDRHLLDLETIIMDGNQIELDEVVITRERMKAKQQLDKTTYYVNDAMQSTSNIGVDIMQYIPGVQVDLMQNISLSGSRDIKILVNGMERDAAFLAQMHPEKIDRIEIKNTPGAEHEAEVSGVINVVLKKNEKTGVSGHIYANMPTANDEVFSFPSASLNYTFNKLTLYTSYNGGFSYFDIDAEDKRNFSQENKATEIVKKQKLFQQNWSHKLHFGMDYFYNENNQFNVYGFISRFSNEQSGDFSISKNINSSESQSTHYTRDDDDINTSAFASFFYKHIFTEGTALSVDAGYYMLRSKNRLHLWEKDNETEQLSHSRPRNNLLKTRVNFHFPLNEHSGINTGIQQNLSYSDDLLMPAFNYTESTTAAYFSANYAKNKWQANAGMRAEYLQYTRQTSGNNKMIMLPALHVKYGFSNTAHLGFSYTKGIDRPSVFQLNPNLQMLDMYASQKGNPALRPAIHHNYHLDYTLVFGNSFLKAGLFHTQSLHIIEILTSVKDGIFLEKEFRNMGNIHQTGISTSGSFKLHENISINPHARIYSVETHPNDPARAQQIESKKAINFESSLSLTALLKHDFAFSFSVQYMSRKTRIQGDYHEDALYFVSLDKTFFGRLKAGITSAIPFMRTFTYRGYEISGRDFSQSIEENINMSVFPLWFKLNYTFASGKKTQRIAHDHSIEEPRIKKGF